MLNKYIDKFVISESKYSHSGNKKKLNFNINKFSEFKSKIIYLVVDDLNSSSNVIIFGKWWYLSPFDFFAYSLISSRILTPKRLSITRENL